MKDKFKQNDQPQAEPLDNAQFDSSNHRRNPPSKSPPQPRYTMWEMILLAISLLLIYLISITTLNSSHTDTVNDLHSTIFILEDKLDSAMSAAVSAQLRLNFCRCEVRHKLLGEPKSELCYGGPTNVKF